MSPALVAAAFLDVALRALLASSEPAVHAGEPALDPQCPMGMPGFVRREGDVCVGKSGPNWTFAFAYPAEAARIAPLDALLRRLGAEAQTDLATLIPYAADHPELRLFHEEAYVVGADRPELLALSFSIAEYSGGAHGWYRNGTLLWDRRSNREIEFGELFTDSGAAFAEVAALLCPVLAEARRRVARRGGGGFSGPCPAPPYAVGLLAGSGGRVDTLSIVFDELDGYAGGEYRISLPVTPRLASLLRESYRPAFTTSEAGPRACNSNLGDDCVEG